MKAMTSTAAAAGLIALTLAGCAAGNGAQSPAVTVTRTVTSTRTVVKEQLRTVPAPAVTQTVTTTVTQTVPAPAASRASSGASGQGQVIAKFNGSGTQNTGSFTTPGNWALSWAYWGCPGGTSNFQVTEYNADGSIDLNGVSVNELGTGRGPVATYAYGDAGTHYLSVNTEGCSWSLVPVTV